MNPSTGEIVKLDDKEARPVPDNLIRLTAGEAAVLETFPCDANIRGLVLRTMRAMAWKEESLQRLATARLSRSIGLVINPFYEDTLKQWDHNFKAQLLRENEPLTKAIEKRKRKAAKLQQQLAKQYR